VSGAGTKECPFCAETIKAAAVLYRFCGRDLPPPGSGIVRTPISRPAPPAGTVVSAGGIDPAEIVGLLSALVGKSLALYGLAREVSGAVRRWSEEGACRGDMAANGRSGYLPPAAAGSGYWHRRSAVRERPAGAHSEWSAATGLTRPRAAV
jgi:hypothetical protein